MRYLLVEKSGSYELFLKLSMELSKDEHMIDSMNVWKIMQNHPYTSSSNFCHWNIYIWSLDHKIKAFELIFDISQAKNNL
jgi:hypothetical protein